MAFLARRPADSPTLSLLDEAGRNALRAAALLKDFLNRFPDAPELAREIVLCEHEGDRITREIIHRLRGEHERLPFDTADGHELATAVDDIVDLAEEIADTFGLYAVEAIMEQAVGMAEILLASCEQIAQALTALRDGDQIAAALAAIYQLESDGDRLSRDAIASLFAGGIDPMVVIRWKDIFTSLEASVDACEHVAHMLEGIDLKRNA